MQVVLHIELRGHWGNMASMFQTPFSKTFEIKNRFRWNISLGSNNICSDNDLAPIRRQPIIRTDDCLFHWRNIASLGINVFTVTINIASLFCIGTAIVNDLIHQLN